MLIAACYGLRILWDSGSRFMGKYFTRNLTEVRCVMIAMYAYASYSHIFLLWTIYTTSLRRQLAYFSYKHSSIDDNVVKSFIHSVSSS